jgi:hypothetical protein
MVQWLWTQKQDIGPGPRVNHAMAYDSVHELVVFFGGFDFVRRKNDTWVWDGEAWTQVAGTGPPPRDAHALTFDGVRQRVVVFGGYGNAGYLNDTWEWDGEVWTQVGDTGPGRAGHAITFDSERQRVVLFGGCKRSPERHLGVGRCSMDPGGRHWSKSALRAYHDI